MGMKWTYMLLMGLMILGTFAGNVNAMHFGAYGHMSEREGLMKLEESHLFNTVNMLMGNDKIPIKLFYGTAITPNVEVVFNRYMFVITNYSYVVNSGELSMRKNATVFMLLDKGFDGQYYMMFANLINGNSSIYGTVDNNNIFTAHVVNSFSNWEANVEIVPSADPTIWIRYNTSVSVNYNVLNTFGKLNVGEGLKNPLSPYILDNKVWIIPEVNVMSFSEPFSMHRIFHGFSWFMVMSNFTNANFYAQQIFSMSPIGNMSVTTTTPYTIIHLVSHPSFFLSHHHSLILDSANILNYTKQLMNITTNTVVESYITFSDTGNGLYSVIVNNTANMNVEKVSQTETVFSLNSTQHRGGYVIINVDKQSWDGKYGNGYTVLFDGHKIPYISYANIVNGTVPRNQSFYSFTENDTRITLIINVPHFSNHTVSVQSSANGSIIDKIIPKDITHGNGLLIISALILLLALAIFVIVYHRHRKNVASAVHKSVHNPTTFKQPVGKTYTKTIETGNEEEKMPEVYYKEMEL